MANARADAWSSWAEIGSPHHLRRNESRPFPDGGSWHKLPGMNLLATVLTLLCLGACGPIGTGHEEGAYHAGWGQDRRVVRDVEAMVQGIQHARAENPRLQREPAVARPGP